MKCSGSRLRGPEPCEIARSSFLCSFLFASIESQSGQSGQLTSVLTRWKWKRFSKAKLKLYSRFSFEFGSYWKGSRACPNLHEAERLVKSSYGFLKFVSFVLHHIIWKLYYNVKILPKFKLSDVAEWIRRLTNELEVPGSSPVDTKAFFSSLLFFLAFKRVNLTIFTIFYHQWELLCCVPNCWRFWVCKIIFWVSSKFKKL